MSAWERLMLSLTLMGMVMWLVDGRDEPRAGWRVLSMLLAFICAYVVIHRLSQ